MQVAEAVPFATREGAQQFIERHGGVLSTFDAIPPERVLDSIE
jgi:nitrous oxide reductase accessory protein NosL